MTHKTTDKFNAVIESISYWLGYQFKIGREQLIHEASLRYPIADTFTGKGIDIDKIILEQLHPIFKSKKIDLVIYEKSLKEVEENHNNIQEVYEFKLAKSGTGDKYSEEHQRVFDDVIRLAYYHILHGKDCYFLMCGKYSDFKSYFIGQKVNIITNDKGKKIVPKGRVNLTEAEKDLKLTGWESTGLYKNWFGFSVNDEKTCDFFLNYSKGRNEWGLRSFQNNYILRKGVKNIFSKKITIKTKCIAITPYGLEKSRTHAAGIWKIEGLIK